MEDLNLLKNRKDFDISAFINNNKAFFFPLLIYVCGLVIGSVFYNVIDQTEFKDIIVKIAQGSDGDFLTLFINKLSVYFAIYTVCVLLGLCLIGFPFVNMIPLICGIEISLKLSYYYVTFGVKGIGYSLLIIAPGAVGFITTIIFTTMHSNTLSRIIYNLTTNKADIIEEINLKSYLLRFFLYSLIVIVMAALGTLFTYILSSIIVL